MEFDKIHKADYDGIKSGKFGEQKGPIKAPTCRSEVRTGLEDGLWIKLLYIYKAKVFFKVFRKR